MEELSMLSWGILAKTVTFCIAALSVHYMLRFYDKRNHVNWGDNYDKLMSGPVGLGIYFGARVIAITSLAGAIYS